MNVGGQDKKRVSFEEEFHGNKLTEKKYDVVRGGAPTRGKIAD